jgi:hypothetical protein
LPAALFHSSVSTEIADMSDIEDMTDISDITDNAEKTERWESAAPYDRLQYA